MWVMVYRFQTSKYTCAQALSAVTVDGGPRLTWEDNASALMDALLIEDDSDTDTIDKQWMRRAADVLPTTEDAGPIDEIDLELARDRMRNGKAPGLDNINPELIKQGWDLLAPHILELYNACLRHGIFPGVWKRGLVRYLVKQGTGIPRIRGPIDQSVSCPRSGSSSKE